MLSKRIVISIIVIGCLVQFITYCSANGPKSQRQSKDANTRETEKPKVQNAKPRAPIKSRDLQPTNIPKGGNQKQVEGIKKPAKIIKKPTGADTTPNLETTPDTVNPNEDPAKEAPAGRFRKLFSIFGRFNNFTKKMCPVRFVGRFLKKKIGPNKPKQTDDEESVNDTK